MSALCLNLFTGEPLAEVSLSTAIDFITQLKAAHGARGEWAELTLEQRISELEKVGQWILAEKVSLSEKLSQAQGLSQEYVLREEVLPAARCFLQVRESQQRRLRQQGEERGFSPFPLGMISLLLPQHFALRFFAEKVSQGLLAGNGFFVKTSPQNPILSLLLKEALTKLPPHLVSIFNGDQELGQLLVLHPSVKGVIAMGRASTTERIAKAAAGSHKKLQLSSGYHNSALILSDADLSLLMPRLLESCFRGMGQLPWNMQNILVLESMMSPFEEQFLEALKALRFAESEKDAQLLSPLHPIGGERIEELWNRVRSENGKILSGGEIIKGRQLRVSPLVVKDLSHCSTLQQDWLGAPLVLVSPVKYTHEMVKWANTSYYGQVAQIFGPPEKREKFGAQIEVGQVLDENGIQGLAKLPVGVKQSSLGEMEDWAFGRFFSQFRYLPQS